MWEVIKSSSVSSFNEERRPIRAIFRPLIQNFFNFLFFNFLPHRDGRRWRHFWSGRNQFRDVRLSPLVRLRLREPYKGGPRIVSPPSITPFSTKVEKCNNLGFDFCLPHKRIFFMLILGSTQPRSQIVISNSQLWKFVNVKIMVFLTQTLIHFYPTTLFPVLFKYTRTSQVLLSNVLLFYYSRL